MEFVFIKYLPWLLGIGVGSLILSLLMLLTTNRYTKKKLKELEQEDASF
jgi:ABC-type phosphate transport system permease subunit